MDTKKLKNALETLKEDLGDALISCDIYPSGVGTPLVGFNSNPQAAALFDRVTSSINKALAGSEFPGLKDYYMLELENNEYVIILIFKDYQWAIQVDSNKVNLGLILNVALPNAKKAFMEALND
jgi:hypothetical protein